MIEQAMPRGNYTSPLQWPTRNFDPALRSQPWWDRGVYLAQLAVGDAAILPTPPLHPY